MNRDPVCSGWPWIFAVGLAALGALTCDADEAALVWKATHQEAKPKTDEMTAVFVFVGGDRGKRQRDREECDAKEPRKNCAHKLFDLLLTDIVVKLQWRPGAQAFHFNLADLSEVLIQAH